MTEHTAAAHNGAVPGAGARQMANILLVDDHEENLLALEAVLQDLGHPMVKACSGKEALKHILERDFAVILLDVHMPEMDGFETAALIRERQRSRSTPIIFLTAVSKAEPQVFKGYSLGAVDYIFKPFVPEVLRAKVNVFIDLFNKTEQVKQQAERLRRIESREHRKEVVLLREQRNRFFHLSVEMMCIIGYDGYIKELNAPWETTLGFPSQELRSRPFLDFVHPEDRKAHQASLSKLEAVPSLILGWESRLGCKDGSFRWVSWSSTAFGKERVYYCAARDITESKNVEETLRTLNETLERRVAERTEELSRLNSELQRSNQELEQFAYVASHDLREPLRKITGFIELFERRYAGKIDEPADQYIRFIKGGANRLQDIISDLLEYSMVGRGERSIAPCDCGQAVEKALANLAASIEESKAAVSIRGPLPTVQADSSQLVSLFQNLVGNAVKFHGAEPPAVRVSARREGREWVFTVKDNGIGIDPKYHDRLFVIFRRLHSRDKYPGTGIGLAICKKIVEGHGGRIWIESQEGQGAAFHFTWPTTEGAA